MDIEETGGSDYRKGEGSTTGGGEEMLPGVKV